MARLVKFQSDKWGCQFAQDLPISVSCLDQGNTQAWQRWWRSAINPVLCKSHPVQYLCSVFKRAWPLIGTVQNHPSAHQRSDLAGEQTLIPKHPCLAHLHRTATKPRQYHQAAVPAASTREPLFCQVARGQSWAVFCLIGSISRWLDEPE